MNKEIRFRRMFKYKVILVATLLLCFSFNNKVQAQNQNLTLNFNNTTVSEVVKEIKAQTGLSVIYNSGDINPDTEISIVSNDESLDAVIKKVLAHSSENLSYEVKDNYIVISSRGGDDTEAILQANEKRTITGTVVDTNNEPLIGVNVIIEGTSTGTATDLDGNFSLAVESGQNQLQVSYIGYETQTIDIAGKNNLQIVMMEDGEVLDEIVVTALGIKRAQKALSYNVQELESEELVGVKDPNFINSINGKVAGVTINKSGSGMGGATRVVMRGEKSIEGDNNTLYVIDGIPIFNSTQGSDSGIMGEGDAGSEGIADFNPEDIESISVLTGPSAAALYGSSAANGAILITTKKGAEGKLQVNISSSTEFSSPFVMPNFQNTYGNKPGSFESWGDKLAVPSSYKPRDFFNTGLNFINSVTLSTGNKQNQTFASVASTNSKGIIPNNTYDRANFTIRNTSQFLNDKVQLDLGASYIKQKNKNMVSQGQYWNPILSAYLYPRGEDFEKIKTFERYDNDRNIPVQYWPLKEGVFASQNPYWIAYRNLSPSKKDRYIFNAGLSYKVLEWLDFAGRIRMDKSNVTHQQKLYATTDEKFARSKGFYEYSEYKDQQLYSDFMVNINKTLADFNFAANIGSSYQDFRALERGYGGDLILVPNLFSIHNIDPSIGKVKEEGGDSRVRNIAVFGNLEVGFKNMLYLTLTGRNDWNSRLVNSAEPSYFYPSVGLSNVVSEMISLPKFVSYLKVRGSYSMVGAPVSRSGMTPGTITTPIKGGVLRPTGIYPYTDFKAERTKSFEFGLSARLFRTLSLEATYYQSNTYNQTFIGELPESSGYKSIYLQAGDVQNRGVEASIGFNDNFGDYNISSSLIFTTNKNEIKEMVKDYRHHLNPEAINIPQVMKENGRVILKEGGSINDIYASKFLAKDNQGFVKLPESGEITLETTEPVYLGKTTPDFTLGWNNSFSYKGFGLNFLINGRFGGVVTSSTQAILDKFGVSQASADARNQGGVEIPNQGLYNAKKYYDLIATGESELAGYYTYSATNVRIQEASLNYTFPSNLFNDVINRLTVSVIANNPLMIYNKAPYDPQLTPSTSTYGQGNDYFMQPSLRSFGFGIKVKL